MRIRPCDLELLLWCHIRVDPHPSIVIGAPSYIEGRDFLTKHDFIEPHGDGTRDRYTTTDRGRAHINQLLSMQWPLPAWVDANGNLIPET